ncbi:MAG: Uma2 family endonuclease [Planctomycetaceae bacterium]|nr:Uma2 family endonuclease [Planctomycetaceae bacterium]
MTTALAASATSPQPATRLPDHTELPETDGSIANNFNELPQSRLLTGAIEPVLRQLHPDLQYAIGQDSGIYYRPTDPPLDGCKAPDWFYVPDVPPMAPGGEIRRSYVLWQEIVAPLLIVEYVSGDGSEERDRTPLKGKFWVYERAIRAPYYAIHDPTTGVLEVHELIGGAYERMKPNSRGHYSIAPMRVELGTWTGKVGNISGVWVRFFDELGRMLPADFERADVAEQRAAAAEAEIARLRQLLDQSGQKP